MREESKMKHVVFVLCEGPHDIAFLYRLFRAQGFSVYKEIIGKFPSPIDELIINALKDADYEEMKLMEVGKKPIPREVFSRDESLVLLYSLGGDGQKDARKDLVKSIFKFKLPDVDALDVTKGLDFSILYFYDADNEGVKKRITEVEQEIKELFEVDNVALSNGGDPVSVKGYGIGCYIFAGDSGPGKLEDILMPMMEKDNEDIFKGAEKFLELKDDGRLKKLELKQEKDGSILEKRGNKKMKFDEAKSKICIAGQLQNSGKSNVVIIKDCDFINLEKIRNSSKCREIMAFINRVIK
ncbi:MAG: hypothetical protein GY765_30790 [bacterium]|nr:hypothetical protein [bacterium]